MKILSCAARQYTMYIVINVNEKDNCSGNNCLDGFILYNTNVVFDRTGAIIARYRKINLFGEAGFNRPNKPELSTFTTDFGVTFGQFICFDILFRKPALELIQENNITDIVFSTHWFSELPYLTANQMQSAWSYANNVNFLGAGYNSPSTGSGGSGIYAGNEGTFANVWSEKRVNALIIAQIPKIINGRRSRPFSAANTTVIIYNSTVIPTTTGIEPVPQQKTFGDYILPYTTQPFKPINGEQKLTLCDRGLCCHFTILTELHDDLNKDNVNYYRYCFFIIFIIINKALIHLR